MNVAIYVCIFGTEDIVFIKKKCPLKPKHFILFKYIDVPKNYFNEINPEMLSASLFNYQAYSKIFKHDTLKQ